MMNEWSPCEGVKWWTLRSVMVIMNARGRFYILDDLHRTVWTHAVAESREAETLSSDEASIILADFVVRECLCPTQRKTTKRGTTV